MERWGTFVRRPNRFVVEVELDGGLLRAHLPNPGRLQEVLDPGRRILLRPAPPGRRTAWTAVGADLGPFLVSLDATLPNRAFPSFLEEGALPELRGYRILAREPRLGEGRADFLLARGQRRLWVEVKSVTLVQNGVALFPDAPTARGRRHLAELAGLARRGEEALVLFVVQRPDADRFGPHAGIDPAFAQAFGEALAAGVASRAVVCRFDGEGLSPLALLGPDELVLPEAAPRTGCTPAGRPRPGAGSPSPAPRTRHRGRSSEFEQGAGAPPPPPGA